MYGTLRKFFKVFSGGISECLSQYQLLPETKNSSPMLAFRTLMLSLIWVRGIILTECCCLIVICWIEITLASVDEMWSAGRNKNLAR